MQRLGRLQGLRLVPARRQQPGGALPHPDLHVDLLLQVQLLEVVRYLSDIVQVQVLQDVDLAQVVHIVRGGGQPRRRQGHLRGQPLGGRPWGPLARGPLEGGQRRKARVHAGRQSLTSSQNPVTTTSRNAVSDVVVDADPLSVPTTRNKH